MKQQLTLLQLEELFAKAALKAATPDELEYLELKFESPELEAWLMEDLKDVVWH